MEISSLLGSKYKKKVIIIYVQSFLDIYSQRQKKSLSFFLQLLKIGKNEKERVHWQIC